MPSFSSICCCSILYPVHLSRFHDCVEVYNTSVVRVQSLPRSLLSHWRVKNRRSRASDLSGGLVRTSRSPRTKRREPESDSTCQNMKHGGTQDSWLEHEAPSHSRHATWLLDSFDPHQIPLGCLWVYGPKPTLLTFARLQRSFPRHAICSGQSQTQQIRPETRNRYIYLKF